MRKHSPVVAEIRLDMLPSPIFLLHRFTSLITHFKYNFWHNIHLFTDFGDCSKSKSGLRELPIAFPLTKSRCRGLPCWKEEVMLGVLMCLKPGVIHHDNDTSQ